MSVDWVRSQPWLEKLCLQWTAVNAGSQLLEELRIRGCPCSALSGTSVPTPPHHLLPRFREISRRERKEKSRAGGWGGMLENAFLWTRNGYCPDEHTPAVMTYTKIKATKFSHGEAGAPKAPPRTDALLVVDNFQGRENPPLLCGEAATTDRVTLRETQVKLDGEQSYSTVSMHKMIKNGVSKENDILNTQIYLFQRKK